MGNSDTDRRATYNKYSNSSHDFCMVIERLKFLVCLTDVLPQSKTNENCDKINDILLAVSVRRQVTPYEQRNDFGQPLTGCISGSNMPILILFVSNCSCNLLDLY